jgi:hypothetical protein
MMVDLLVGEVVDVAVIDFTAPESDARVQGQQDLPVVAGADFDTDGSSVGPHALFEEPAVIGTFTSRAVGGDGSAVGEATDTARPAGTAAVARRLDLHVMQVSSSGEGNNSMGGLVDGSDLLEVIRRQTQFVVAVRDGATDVRAPMPYGVRRPVQV